MFFLIVLCVSSYCLETIPSLRGWLGWWIIDACVSIIFSLEYFIRLFATRRKWLFIIQPINLIDMLSFLPFYLETILLAVKIDQRTLYDWFRVLRVFRLSKALRVSRYKKTTNILTIFSETAILARHSFTMLVLSFLFCTIVLASLTYAAEEKAGTFLSVFEALYWCIITQTTLGYGDIPIVTPAGRILACVTAYIGIINLTFMINVLGSCFDEAYTRFLTREERALKERLISELCTEELERGLAETCRKTKTKTLVAAMSGDLGAASAMPSEKPMISGKITKKVGIQSIYQPSSVRLKSNSNESGLQDLVLKLTRLLGRLIENDLTIQSHGYASVRRSMIEVRELLDKKI